MIKISSKNKPGTSSSMAILRILDLKTECGKRGLSSIRTYLCENWFRVFFKKGKGSPSIPRINMNSLFVQNGSFVACWAGA